MRLIVMLTCVLALAPAASGAASPSPYTESQSREIKALSSEDLEGLLAGRGMGYALAAELNGYPGPRHVLDLADELELSASQQRQVAVIFDAMQSEAGALGERIVAAERELDTAFADETITTARLERATLEIGRLEGQLRAVHLAAHIDTRALLSPPQIHVYGTLRGYTDTEHSEIEHHGHH